MSVDDWATQKDIFGDRESMLKVWLDERRSRDISAGLMWENLKLFSLLIPAIISVDTFFLGFIFDNSSQNFTYVLALLSLVLPGLVISLSWCGSSDLKRRWERTLESIAYLNKLEGLLGLRDELKIRNVFKDDDHLFERYFQEANYVVEKEDANTGEITETRVDIKTEKEFKERKMYTNNMYTAMNKVYFIFGIIGVFLWSAPLTYLVYLNLPHLEKLLQ